MAVNTRSVHGRRDLRFESLQHVLIDAELLAQAKNVRMLGNKPLDGLLNHLAMAIEGSLDGIPFKTPWYMRLVGPLFKKRLITKKMPPGFNLPRSIDDVYFPSSATALEAFERLRSAIERTHTQRMASTHPILGSLTHEEWTKLHLRHAELHLSFARAE